MQKTTQPIANDSPPKRINFPRLLAGMAMFALLVVAAWLWWMSRSVDRIYLLPARSPAEWIVYAASIEGLSTPRLEMATVFRRSMELESVPAVARLRIAGLQRPEISINGNAPTRQVRTGRNWKEPDVFEVADLLRAGTNEIVVTVHREGGAPALWCSLEAGTVIVNSDESWTASHAGASWKGVRRASQPGEMKPGHPRYGGERPLTSLRMCWPTLLLFVTLAVGGCGLHHWWIKRQRSPDNPGFARVDLWLALGLAGGWLALFANNLSALPPWLGFDVLGHLEYITHLRTERALPGPHDGWEMHQPPLYYLLGAGLLELAEVVSSGADKIMVLRLLGLTIGVTHFLVVWLTLRWLFPGERTQPMAGLILAAALPAGLYLAHYITNETLAALLVSVTVYLMVRLLRQPVVSWKLGAVTGLCLGAALLAKITAVLLLPVIAAVFLMKIWESGKTTPAARRWLQIATVMFLVCAVTCGWHYGRVWWHTGTLTGGGWAPEATFRFWQDDAYRTGDFYQRFGTVLMNPWFASARSFADGLYSTLWGDGLFAGATDFGSRPPWNYNLMAVGYWLALLPTVAMALGAALALAQFFRRPSAEGVLLLGLAGLTALALIHRSLVSPDHAAVKAFYGLVALGPLAVFGSIGFATLSRQGRWLGPLLGVGLGVWMINSFASLWIQRAAPATVHLQARSLLTEGRLTDAISLLQTRLAETPDNLETRALLASVLLDVGRNDEALTHAGTVLQLDPDNVTARLTLATGLARSGQMAAAIDHARRAAERAPGDGRTYQQWAAALVHEGRHGEAISVAREGLAVAPFNAGLRLALGSALHAQQQPAEAAMQLGYAARLNPDWPTAEWRLASALTAAGDLAKAVFHYREALRLAPNTVEALNNLAWILATSPQSEFRDGAEAVQLAERACELTQHQQAQLLGTLAAAYAEAGQYAEAVRTAQLAVTVARAAGQLELAARNQELSALYERQQPYRDLSLSSTPSAKADR